MFCDEIKTFLIRKKKSVKKLKQLKWVNRLKSLPLKCVWEKYKKFIKSC